MLSDLTKTLKGMLCNLMKTIAAFLGCDGMDPVSSVRPPVISQPALRPEQASQTADARSRERKSLQSQVDQLQEISRQERKQWEAERLKLTTLHETRQHSTDLPAQWRDLLQHICSDTELTRRFELPAEQGDLDLLLAAVAVLAQSNNFKRLWEFYKDRCVDKKGPLTDADLKVLQSALAWLNANWPTKPYTLYSPMTGETYDYEKHMRPPGANTGDKIQAVWLPGITELKLKPLVATR